MNNDSYVAFLSEFTEPSFDIKGKDGHSIPVDLLKLYFKYPDLYISAKEKGNLPKNVVSFFNQYGHQLKSELHASYTGTAQQNMVIGRWLRQYYDEMQNASSEIQVEKQRIVRKLPGHASHKHEESEEDSVIRRVIKLTQEKKLQWVCQSIGENKWLFSAVYAGHSYRLKTYTEYMAGGERFTCDGHSYGDINKIYRIESEILKAYPGIRSSRGEDKNEHPMESPNRVTIRPKDFVVWMNVFRCASRKHKLIDISAEFSVVNDEGKTIHQYVPAGYCKDCDVYFILEKTYLSLKRMGVILCRVSDEKHYLRMLARGRIQLAQESPLHQYGYNVSAAEGLSDVQRRKILAALIDNKVMTRAEIMSYLSMFTNLNGDRFMRASALWQMDYEFVSGYRMGDYQKYGVKAVRYRR